jgi:hypothetical protein
MKIAVVIPLYNKRETILRCLDSVRAQTRRPDEIVVVDDGSTDGGAEQVASWTGPDLRMVRQPNGGVAAARNRGVAEAASEWVAFLDADDEWLPGFLAATAHAAARQGDAGVVFTNLRLSTSRTAWLPGGPGGVLQDYFAFFVANRGHGMSASSVLVRREVLLRAGGFPAGRTHGEDLDTWTRLAWETRVAYVPEVLAIYHVIGSTRAMDAGRRPVAAGLAHCVQMCRERLRDGRVPVALRRSTRAYAQMLSVMCARELKDAGDAAGALRALGMTFPPAATPRALRLHVGAFLRSACPAALLNLLRTGRSGLASS